MAKRQSSLLDGEQCKQAKTPPQSDHEEASTTEHTRSDRHREHKYGRSKTRSKDGRQRELNRVHSKSTKRLKSRVHSKSRARSKSKGGAWKPGVWMSHREQSPSKGHHEEENKPCKEPIKTRSSPLLPNYSYEQLRARNNRSTEHPAPTNCKQSKHDKLKEEVVKQPHEYIHGCTVPIAHTLAPNHKAVKCLVAFGKNTLKYATEILATIKWGTQHWQLQKPFPVPLPCAASAQVALHTTNDTNDDAIERGIATTSFRNSHKRHPHLKSHPVGVDGCTPLILERSHDRGPLRRMCLPG